MRTLLRIDCSARTEGSHSRMLADFFEQKWRATEPDGQVIYRDLAREQVPHIEDRTIVGFYTPRARMSEDLVEATTLSDGLIAELRLADELLISSPLYNLSIPSSLKAYIDQVVRIGQTFTIEQDGYRGLLGHIEAHVITVKGGVMKGTPMEAFDFQEPYLKAAINYLGMKMGSLFSLEGTSHENLVGKNTEQLHQSINKYFNNRKQS